MNKQHIQTRLASMASAQQWLQEDALYDLHETLSVAVHEAHQANRPGLARQIDELREVAARAIDWTEKANGLQHEQLPLVEL